MSNLIRRDKINLALLWPEYSGNVTSVNDLVLKLDKERFNAIFIYLSGFGVEGNLIEDSGYKVFYLSNIELINAFRFSILFKLVNILKKHDIDILHCHAHKPTVYGAIAARLAGTQVVLSHVHGLGRSANFRRKLTNFLLFGSKHRVISVAHGVKDDVLRNNWCLSPEKVAVLENSVDYGRFADVPLDRVEARKMLGLPSEAFVFGAVGRLAPTKGLSYLIDAFPVVKDKVPSAHLVFLGDGPSRAELEKQASNLSCRSSIHFLGRRDNIEQLFRGMDAFVLSSVAEGMPRVILEAMASGVPSIATRVGGIPEILSSPELGILVPPRDSQALAGAMMSLVEMPEEQRQELVNTARERIHNYYAHDVIVKKLEKIYLDSLCRQKG